MSMEALLNGVVDRILSVCGYSPRDCGVQPDGSPETWNGQIYVAVHPFEIRQVDDNALRMHEAYSLGVTLTMRTAWLPKDKLGPKIVARGTTGIYARAQAIRAAVHMSYAVITSANADIGATENGFLTPLVYEGMGRLTKQGPAWFSSPMKAPDHSATGYSLEIRFGGAERVQKLEEMS